jgi:hypothetical protein
MLRRLRGFLVLPVALLALIGAPAASSLQSTEEENGPNNIVVAETAGQHLSKVKAKTQVRDSDSDPFQPGNAAVAYAHDCTGCHSTAVAVQVALATGEPQTFTPENLGVSINENCNECVSFSYAWQYALDTNGPVELTEYGERRVSELRHEIRDTAESVWVTDLESANHLRSLLDAKTTELRNVIDAELRHEGGEQSSRVRKRVDYERSH